jgi:4'-phosphopantetheinyl transferase
MLDESIGNHWHVPDNFPGIEPGVLHIWRSIYDPFTATKENFLSQEEQARHDRFHFAQDRLRFRFSHGLLRRLLASYLNQQPYEIQFCYTQYGKPYLETSENQAGVEFNMSHSGDVILVGITRSIPVGVDVEKIEPLPDMDQIAARFFAKGEQIDLFSLSGPKKITAYYQCWTRKEAVIKASGEGLSMPLDSFRVSLLPEEPVRVIKSSDDKPWTLFDLTPAGGYAAAAAAPVSNLRVCYFSAREI